MYVCGTSAVGGGLLEGGAWEFGTSCEDGDGEGRDHRAAPDTGDPVRAGHLVINQPISGQGLHCCRMPIGWRDLGTGNNI